MTATLTVLEATLALAAILRRAKVLSLSGDFPTVTPRRPIRARVALRGDCAKQRIV
jgi:hypothetical protein